MKILPFTSHFDLRLKRQSPKVSPSEVLALLELLEANERNRYDNANDDIDAFDSYRKPLFVPSTGLNEPDNESNDGEWWNEYFEPSVQYYGNAPIQHIDPRSSVDAHLPYKRKPMPS